MVQPEVRRAAVALLEELFQRGENAGTALVERRLRRQAGGFVHDEQPLVLEKDTLRRPGERLHHRPSHARWPGRFELGQIDKGLDASAFPQRERGDPLLPAVAGHRSGHDDPTHLRTRDLAIQRLGQRLGEKVVEANALLGRLDPPGMFPVGHVPRSVKHRPAR